MIIAVDETNLLQAAEIHSISWKESHCSFCTIARRKPYIAERTTMEEKTIKELAVELTVEITELCDEIKARAEYSIKCVPLQNNNIKPFQANVERFAENS